MTHFLTFVSSADSVKTDFLPLFSNLMNDEQDTVRLLAVEACLAFAKLLPKEDAATLIIPHLQTAARV